MTTRTDRDIHVDVMETLAFDPQIGEQNIAVAVKDGIVTLSGITIGRLLGGAVLVETIFALPGLGRYTIDAINNRDFMALQGAVVVATVGFVVVNFAVDMLHGVIDPRITAERVA